MLNTTFRVSALTRLAQASHLGGITYIVGAPFLRVSCEEAALSLSKGRESEMPAPGTAAMLVQQFPRSRAAYE